MNAVVSSGFSKQSVQQHLVRQLASLPGLPAKAAQLLGMRLGFADEIPYRKMEMSQVRTLILQRAPSLAAEIDEIDPQAFSASLGQVHRARLQDGRTVAIKVLWPNAQDDFKNGLELLLAGMRRFAGRGAKTFDVDQYEQFFNRILVEETSYTTEAKNQLAFKSLWDRRPGFCVPDVLEEFGTESILVQEFVPSTPIRKIVQERDKKECAERIVEFFARSFLQDGLVHADLHPDNWGWSLKGLVVYDYGASLRLPKEAVQAFRSLTCASELTVSEALQGMGGLGFSIENLRSVADRLPELNAILFSPLRTAAWRANEWSFAGEVDRCLGGDKWWFRSAGPPWFMLFMRSAMGVISGLRILGVEVDVKSIVEDILQQRIGEHSSNVLGIKEPKDQAKALRIEITENGRPVVELEFPAATVESLQDIMPETAIVRLQEQNIDLVQIRNQAVSSGLQPQSLFSTVSGSRCYKVWLE